MDTMRPPVPPVKRSYDASGRRARAGQTRRRVLHAARRLFLTDGYARTTVSAIAAEAEVSVDTIYKAFGNKPRLVKAVFDLAIAGTEPVAADERAARVSREESDPRARLRRFGGFLIEVMPRAAPVMLLVRAAADTDPGLARVWEEMNDERLASMARHARRLRKDGFLRSDVTVAQARDLLWAYCSPELYDLLVQRRGWTIERFGAWVGESYIAALLPSPGRL